MTTVFVTPSGRRVKVDTDRVMYARTTPEPGVVRLVLGDGVARATIDVRL